MFTDILAGSSFSPLPDMFLLLYVFDYTHILPVCVFSPPKAKKKKRELSLPSDQTDRQRGRKARGAGEVGVGFTSLGVPTDWRKIISYPPFQPLASSNCGWLFFFLILTPQKGLRRRRNSSSLSKLH